MCGHFSYCDWDLPRMLHGSENVGGTLVPSASFLVFCLQGVTNTNNSTVRHRSSSWKRPVTSLGSILDPLTVAEWAAGPPSWVIQSFWRQKTKLRDVPRTGDLPAVRSPFWAAGRALRQRVRAGGGHPMCHPGDEGQQRCGLSLGPCGKKCKAKRH